MNKKISLKLNKKHLSIRNLAFNIIISVILTVLIIIFMFPIFLMVSKSLMTFEEANLYPPILFPKTPLFANYFKVFSLFDVDVNGISYLLVYFFNTLIILVTNMVGGILSAAMCAYGFSKIRFPGRDKIFILVLSCLMIPSSVMMIPLYIMFAKIGWTNSLLPLTLPAVFGGGAMNIFLMRQFMRTIPNELSESSKIDGASHLRTFWQIIMPNCKPIIIAIMIYYFTGLWNDVMGPLIYTNTQEHWTLALGVTNMFKSGIIRTEGGQIMIAICVIMSIFPLLVFFFGQKYFIEGVVLTGGKE